MTKIWKILNLIVLGLLILICILGTFYKQISFGLGLGDIFGYLFLYAVTIIHLVLTLILRKKGTAWHIILTITFLFFTILISLRATIWRGSEYSWNGSVFYLPCPTEIMIENGNTKKELLIQMCSMEYDSEFSGIWDGKQLIIKQGEIKIPKKLKSHIKQPIVKVEIEPDSWFVVENDILIEEPRFDKDTLKVNQHYIFAGEIMAIRNYQPVVKSIIIKQ